MWAYCKYLLLLFLASLALIAVLPGIPPDDIKFEYTARPKFIPFEGKLSVNNILDEAERLHEGVLVGPESFVVHENVLYTGLATGEIIKYSNDKFTVIANCGGRAVGFRMGRSGHNLLVADIFHGISAINIKTGAVQVLAPLSVPVEGQPAIFPDDLDVDSDGIIYYSDASRHGTEFLPELLGEPTGRIIRFDPVKNVSSVLDKGLHFPNGIQLTPDHKAVLYCETFKHRLLKHHLKGNDSGKTEVFSDLPGGCDNIRLTSRGTYYVAIVSPLTKDEDKYLGELPMLRRWVLRVLTLTKLAVDKVEEMFPNTYTHALSHTLLSVEGLPKLIGPKPYSLLLELDASGEVLNSYHSPTGKVGGMSQVVEFDGYLYMGGFDNNYLARIPLDKLKK